MTSEIYKDFPIGSKVKVVGTYRDFIKFKGAIGIIIGHCQNNLNLIVLPSARVEFNGKRFNFYLCDLQPIEEQPMPTTEEPKEHLGNKYFLFFNMGLYGVEEVVFSFNTKEELLRALSDCKTSDGCRVIYGKELSIDKTIDLVEKE